MNNQSVLGRCIRMNSQSVLGLCCTGVVTATQRKHRKASVLQRPFYAGSISPWLTFRQLQKGMLMVDIFRVASTATINVHHAVENSAALGIIDGEEA